jgi:hypothetical protein
MERNSTMNRTHWLKRVTCLSLLTLVAVSVGATTASSAVGGLPPSMGTLCGQVTGASWKFQGQTGTTYNVVGQPAGSCGVAMKSVAALTRQKPRSGAVGAQTLTAPSGFRCAGSGIPLAHAGFCGRGAMHFTWAPHLKK